MGRTRTVGMDAWTCPCALPSQILEKSVSPEIAQRYAELIPPIVRMARACIRDLDPQVCGKTGARTD